MDNHNFKSCMKMQNNTLNEKQLCSCPVNYGPQIMQLPRNMQLPSQIMQLPSQLCSSHGLQIMQLPGKICSCPINYAVAQLNYTVGWSNYAVVHQIMQLPIKLCSCPARINETNATNGLITGGSDRILKTTRDNKLQ